LNKLEIDKLKFQYLNEILELTEMFKVELGGLSKKGMVKVISALMIYPMPNNTEMRESELKVYERGVVIMDKKISVNMLMVSEPKE